MGINHRNTGSGRLFYMKLVLVSDTHTFHDQVNTGEGDVLIHAGDMGLSGSQEEIQACLDWLNKQSFERIVAIAGNHDWAFAREDVKGYLDIGRINYLENSSVNIDGVNFYGSPVQPEFCNWAFNVSRGSEIKKYWDMIPDAGQVDVLITHGPPMGILDQSRPNKNSEHLGCEDLIKQIEISLPKISVFGHIHGGYGQREYKGMKFFNASQVNEIYRVVNKPWEVEI
jgi:Icc-related predicted phosphoesterase